MSILNEARVEAADTVLIASEADLLRVRSALRTHAQEAGLGLTATTKLVTAGSELARNIIRYAVGGEGTVFIKQCGGAQGGGAQSGGMPDGGAQSGGAQGGGARHGGVHAEFCDAGPGIADLDAAMRDGFSSAGGLGLGLPGSRRLVDDFRIQSAPGRGTTVVIEQWTR